MFKGEVIVNKYVVPYLKEITVRVDVGLPVDVILHAHKATQTRNARN